MRRFLTSSSLALLVGCSSPGASTPADAGRDAFEPTAVLGAVSPSIQLSTAQTIATLPVMNPADPGPPSTPSVLAGWLDAGYGATTIGAGEPILTRMPPDGGEVPDAGPNPTMLVRFVHLPDIQLADDESPTRACAFDAPTPSPLNGAFRPQEADECRILNAAVRTINSLSTALPIAFVLTGGDNADNAQKNEIEWFLQIMSGSPRVKCDSAEANDPVPGPNNDGKDPFEADGLAMPWWWVTGNHDLLVVGNQPVTAATQAQATGTMAAGKTRDYRLPGAPLTKGPVPADPNRIQLMRPDLMKLVAADGNGHGIGDAQVASGKAYYSFDVANSPLRFIIIDSVAETGNDEGVIHQADLTSTLKPMLDQSVTDQKYVVIASHHATSDITDGSGLFGPAQADALTPQQWVDFLGGYNNLLFSMVGHVHLHRITYITPTSGHSFWEVMTGALADPPNQFRLVEIWDDDNGWIRLRGVAVDYDDTNDPVGAIGRMLGVTDYVSGWGWDGRGTTQDQNVDILIPKPTFGP